MTGIRMAVVAGVMAVFATGVAAEAAELRARCEYKAPKKDGRGERTRVRVDGKDVAEGEYTVTVNGTYTATVSTETEDGETEFSARFRSDRGAIPADLGAGESVTISVSGLVEEVVLLCPGRTRIDVE